VAETEILKIKDDSKIDRETNLDRRGLSQIGTDWHFPDPRTFSLPSTFKGIEFGLAEVLFHTKPILVIHTEQRYLVKITGTFCFEK
jgi:hypothetical protein